MSYRSDDSPADVAARSAANEMAKIEIAKRHPVDFSPRAPARELSEEEREEMERRWSESIALAQWGRA